MPPRRPRRNSGSTAVSWFRTHQQLLRELFDALGKSDDWSDDPTVLIEHTLPRWLGTEHGQVGQKEQFSDQQIARARPILAALGLTEGMDPPRQTYDEVVVLGAAGIGLHRRLELVRTSRVQADRLMVLAGLRPHIGAAGDGRDGRISELLATEGRFASAPGWRPPARLRHQAELLAAAGVDEDRAAQVLLPSETDLARLLLTKQWPDARLRRVVPATTPHTAENPELGQRTIARCEWDGPPTMPLLSIINGAPVERDHGPPRPTTASTLAEWLALTPPDAGARHVLFIVNQPHVGRVGLTIHAQLAEVEPPITFDLAGCGTLTDVGIHLLLGEIPARMDLERQANLHT